MAAPLKITIDDPRFVKALAHPLRIRILAMLQERDASPVMLARHLELPVGRVAHHFRVLRQLNVIELVETHQRRGAVEHVYRAVAAPQFSDETWAQLGGLTKQRLLAAMLTQIGEYVAGSAAAGGFERSDANVSRVPMQLDEQGWQELTEAGLRWLAEADEIQSRARERTSAADEAEAFDAGMVLLLFEALPFSARPQP